MVQCLSLGIKILVLKSEVFTLNGNKMGVQKQFLGVTCISFYSV